MDKCKKLCGLCFKEFVNLRQHFKVRHTIENQKERLLLLKYGSARLDKPFDCPVCDKKNLIRLDKHLLDVHKMYNPKERQDLLIQVKRAYFVKQLALLRKTEPDPPMVSSLDGPVDDNSDPDSCGLLPIEEDPFEEEPLLKSPEDKVSEHLEADDMQVTSPCQPQLSTSAGPSPGLCISPDMPSPKTSLDSSGISSFSRSSQSRAGAKPSSGKCQDCELLKKEVTTLMARVDTLERKVRHLFTPQKRPFPKTGSAQKGEKVLEDLSTSVYGQILKDFADFRTGGRTGNRARDNANLSMSHARRFIKFMITGSKGVDCEKDLLFLNQVPRLRLWASYLAERGYKVSSIKNMLLNVVHFFRHVENSFLAESKLTLGEVHKIIYELKGIQRDVCTKLVVHRQQVLRAKTENQVSAREQLDFLKVAKKKIPELLDNLYVQPNSDDLSNKTIGYLMCYLAIITGHRSVVFCNLQKQHVKDAEEWANGQKFRVLVDEHKTVRSFGQASLSLHKEEYDWLVLLHIISERRASSTSRYLFHHTDGRRVNKPSRLLSLAWADAGLKTQVSFGMIRSSVSTQASKHLTLEQRKDLAKAMCHDVSTADRFYVALPDKAAAHETRKQRMNALFLEARSGGQKGRSAKSGKDKDEKRARSPTSSSTSSEVEQFIPDDNSEPDTSQSEDQSPVTKRRCSEDHPHPKASRELTFETPFKLINCSVSLNRLNMLKVTSSTPEEGPVELFLVPETQQLDEPCISESMQVVQETQIVDVVQEIQVMDVVQGTQDVDVVQGTQAMYVVHSEDDKSYMLSLKMSQSPKSDISFQLEN